MRRPASRFAELALALLVTCAAARAQAQACCAGAGVFAPARLKLSEDALFGVQLRGRDVVGSFDATGSYLSAPSNTTELDFEQDLYAVFRAVGNLQVGLVAPLIETHRATPGLAETGWGLGDLQVTGRYELVPPNTRPSWPGIALQASVTLPSGRAPEDARNPLSTDATGVGAWQFSLGLDVERAFGRLIVDGNAAVAQRLARQVGEVRERLGVQGQLGAAVGYVLHGELALAGFGSFAAERAAEINGETVPDSDRAEATVGLSLGVPIDDAWRMQARAFDDLPVLGKNQTAGPGVAATVLRTW